MSASSVCTSSGVCCVYTFSTPCRRSRTWASHPTPLQQVPHPSCQAARAQHTTPPQQGSTWSAHTRQQALRRGRQQHGRTRRLCLASVAKRLENVRSEKRSAVRRSAPACTSSVRARPSCACESPRASRRRSSSVVCARPSRSYRSANSSTSRRLPRTTLQVSSRHCSSSTHTARSQSVEALCADSRCAGAPARASAACKLWAHPSSSVTCGFSTRARTASKWPLRLAVLHTTSCSMLDTCTAAPRGHTPGPHPTPHVAARPRHGAPAHGGAGPARLH